MPVSFRVLGRPGRDNTLFVTVDTGQHLTRRLFDCGDGCPHALPFADVLATDHLLFSHRHMDHVGGFDAFFRATHKAAAAGVDRLVLFCLSDRYQPDGWRQLLAEARAVFPNTLVPDGWAVT